MCDGNLVKVNVEKYIRIIIQCELRNIKTQRYKIILNLKVRQLERYELKNKT